MFSLKRWAEAGIAAGALAMATTAAFASTTGPSGTTFPTVQDYAVESVAANGNFVAIPAGITYTFTVSPTDVAGSFQLLFTLPAGVNFSTNPTLTVTAAGAGCPALGSMFVPVGNNGPGTLIYTIPVTGAGAPTTCTLTANNFDINNAVALGSQPGVGPVATSTFKYTLQAFNATPLPANQDLNDLAPFSGVLAGSQNAFVTVFGLGSATTPCAIDITSPSFAKLFRCPLFAPPPSTVSGDVGGLAATLLPTRNALNTAPFAFTNTTFALTLTGTSFANIATAYIAPGVAACKTTVPAGAIVGTVSATSISFANVPFPLAGGAQSEACLIANGSGVLAANPVIAASATIDAGLPTATTNTGFMIGYGYNGAAKTFSYVLTGGNLAAGFTSFIRVVNQTGAPVAIPANVWVDGAADGSTAGSTTSILLLNPLAPNGGATLLFSNILAAAGLAPPADGRAFIQVLLPAGTNADSLLGNQNNTFVFDEGSPN